MSILEQHWEVPSNSSLEPQLGKGSKVVHPHHGRDFKLKFWGLLLIIPACKLILLISFHVKMQLWFSFNFYNAIRFNL